MTKPLRSSRTRQVTSVRGGPPYPHYPIEMNAKIASWAPSALSAFVNSRGLLPAGPHEPTVTSIYYSDSYLPDLTAGGSSSDSWPESRLIFIVKDRSKETLRTNSSCAFHSKSYSLRRPLSKSQCNKLHHMTVEFLTDETASLRSHSCNLICMG